MATNRFTIAIRTDENGNQYFIHFICGLRSYNQNDIKFKYCANCHTFPEDQEKFEKLEAIQKEAETMSIEEPLLRL
jgi:hypothetical protein